MKTLNKDSDISELIELFKQHNKDIFHKESYEIIFDDLLKKFDCEIPIDKIDVNKLAKKYKEYDSFNLIYIDYEGQSGYDFMLKRLIDGIKKNEASWRLYGTAILSFEIIGYIKYYLNSYEIGFWELSTGKILVRYNND